MRPELEAAEGDGKIMDRTRRASLPLYRLPELDGAKASFWRAVRTEFARAGGRDAPDELDLDRPSLPDSIEPDTLFTQVCGYPMQKFFSSQARLLAAPVYEAEYCDGTTHCGIFVVRRLASYERLEDLRGRSLVFGGPFSNSGMNLPRRTLAEVAHGDSFFESAVETDSQAGNLERVARGEVDATCVDNVTYAYVALHRPQVVAALRILAATPRSPSIPFVTSAATDPDTRELLVVALRAVASSPEWADARAGLMLRDIVPIDAAKYEVLVDYEREAAALGYPVLC
jgi:ABC-type phosphate/phosphonate transport system substrate-binding protein